MKKVKGQCGQCQGRGQVFQMKGLDLDVAPCGRCWGSGSTNESAIAKAREAMFVEEGLEVPE